MFCHVFGKSFWNMLLVRLLPCVSPFLVRNLKTPDRLMTDWQIYFCICQIELIQIKAPIEDKCQNMADIKPWHRFNGGCSARSCFDSVRLLRGGTTSLMPASSVKWSPSRGSTSTSSSSASQSSEAPRRKMRREVSSEPVFNEPLPVALTFDLTEAAKEGRSQSRREERKKEGGVSLAGDGESSRLTSES